MSNKIIGTSSRLKDIEIRKRSKRLDSVPVDVPSLRNRATKAATLVKFLNNWNGVYDEGLWQRPTVIELPSGEQFLIDGDHSRHLFKLAYPDAKEMPVEIVAVKDEPEAHRMFINKNKSGKKNLTADELFCHEYWGNEAPGVKTEKDLNKCFLSVDLGTNEPGTVVGSKEGFNVDHGVTVGIPSFRKAIKKSGSPAVAQASIDLQSVFVNDRLLRSELLEGISLVYGNRDTLSSSKAVQLVKEHLGHLKVSHHGVQLNVSTALKTAAGAKVNKHDYCVALGFLTSLAIHVKSLKDAELTSLYKKLFAPQARQFKRIIKG